MDDQVLLYFKENSKVKEDVLFRRIKKFEYFNEKLTEKIIPVFEVSLAVQFLN